MTQMEPDYAEPQRQVQRWLGRCMLSLQQSERMLKAFLVDSQVSVRIPVAACGPPHVTRAYEKEKVAAMTLGGLVSLFCGDVVIADGQPELPEEVQQEPVKQVIIEKRFSMVLEKVAHEQMVTSMREMVQTRNDLVHHLIERFNLVSLDGCSDALEFLQQCYARIEAFREQLVGYGEQMLASAQYLQDALETKPIREFVVSGKVPLQGSSMMDAMQAAFTACAQGSIFAPLQAFTAWLEQHRPEENYQKYGRVSWAQLIHESELYRIQRTDEAGQKIAARVVSQGTPLQITAQHI